MKTNREGKRRNFLLAWIRGSVILQMLDKLSERIYRSFGTGFFGWLFTGYSKDGKSVLTALVAEGAFGRMCRKVWRFVNYQIEGSLILILLRRCIRRLLRCRMRVFGFCTATFGLYTGIFHLIRALLAEENISVPDHPELLFALGVLCFSIPLLLSRVTLVQTLCHSISGNWLLRILDYDPDQVRILGEGEPVSRVSIAFVTGIVLGLMTLFVAPWWIFAGIGVLFCAWLLLCKPEIGVMILFFTMPFLPTMVLAGLVMYVFVCFCLKLLRGKRIVHIEPLDIMVIAFAVILGLGGVISLSDGSLKPALLFVCFLAGYFEVVWLIRERKWLVRCATAGVVSATLTALYGIFQYFFGSALMAEAWLDAEMFDSIGGRAVATLENPNMLGEYLILMIPLAVVMLVGYGEGMRRTAAFACLGVLGACLILTWSRGAWLGLIFAAVLFLFIWHRRSMWLLFAGVASIPVLPYVLPQTIIERFTSIGNLSDSSTSYRVYIWRATCDMLRDLGFTGIGIGESAWNRVYPLYAYLGVEKAPHSHNLFLQIWLETGICGLLVFLLILFWLVQSVFTFYRELQETKRLAIPRLRGMKAGSLSGTEFNRLDRKTRMQLRLTCAAPLAGIFAVLVQGMTDYAWYNYRIYLMFWLMIGLTSAYVRSGRSMMLEPLEDEEDCAALDLPYRTGSRKQASLQEQNNTENGKGKESI